MHPFDDISSKFEALANQILETEQAARRLLPGVPWSFRDLHENLLEMAKLVKKGLPLAACNLHGSASIPAAVKLGRMSSPRKRAAAYAASLKASTVRSAAKRQASRDNLVKARIARIRKERAFADPVKFAAKTAILQRKLKWNLDGRSREVARPEDQRDQAKVLLFDLRIRKLKYAIMDRAPQAMPAFL